ncbi:BrnT family toxin [Granulicella sp. dw_53]|uniref:BrnT family toxin n=1 Tax=Granulicella sp. dw_53 TaxID=2719792 RepID=UPI0031F63695
MRFDWDQRKNLSNYRKHRVLFETATLVFDDPDLLMDQDRRRMGRRGGRPSDW